MMASALYVEEVLVAGVDKTLSSESASAPEVETEAESVAIESESCAACARAKKLRSAGYLQASSTRHCLSHHQNSRLMLLCGL